ncbi:MAG: L,D-transpeptidase family protein [Planctomycetes bacterium]|nr:L,D-transpeptidase family protein [Planctomycetota bacterium]
MASRRSRRKKKKGGGIKSFVSAVIVLGIIGGGGWYLYQGNNDGMDSDSPVADLVPELTKDADGEPVIEDDNHMFEVESEMEAIETRLYSTDGADREKMMIQEYTKLAKTLTGPIPSYEARSRILVTFHQLTDELFLGTNHNKFNGNYVVKGGDNFAKIASRQKCSIELIWRLNGLPSGTTKLHPGDNLKVPGGKPSVVVRKRDYTTSIYLGAYMVRQYIVAHGKNNNTPLGKTSIISMEKNPEEGVGQNVKEMKLRWVGLARFGGNRTGIGFHGTQYPESIPGQTSKGCMRMHDGDVVELYDIIRIGNKVEVRA